MKTYPGLPEPQAEILLDYETSAIRYNHQSEFLIASLHLCGNTTQWILAGLGGATDQRDRPAEFAAEHGADGARLCAQLAEVVAKACDVVDSLDVARLLRPHRIQGYEETGLSAALHVLEHFSGHAGQIYAWTKQVTGVDLRFYDL